MTGRRPFCYADPECIRAYLHSGEHLPGCRNCGKPGHTEPDCTDDPFYAPIGDDVTPKSLPPTDGPFIVGTTPEFSYLPPACKQGTCTHDRCTRSRSRRCLSGECRCASQGRACGEVIAKPKPLQEWERDLIASADDTAPVRDVTADENAAQGD